MKKILSTLTFIVAIALVGFSQSSDEILNELSSKAKTFETITASYTSHLVDVKSDLNLTQSGKVEIKGKKYVLDLPDYKIYSDDTNLYTYEKESNVCYVDYIEDVADGAFNPSEMFTIWENDFKHELAGEEMVKGKKAYIIHLYPNESADKPFHTIRLFVDKAKMEVMKIEVKGREGDDMIYELDTFKTNVPMDDVKFRFQKTDFPGVELIDQRI